MKRLLVTLAALLLVAGLSSCVDDADAQAEVNCDRVEDLDTAISSTKKELEAARADVRDSEGTPDESKAKERVRELRRILRQLRGCSEALAETTTTSTTTAAPAECGDRFMTKLDENRKSRVLSNGVQAPTSEAMRQEILDFNSQDPRGLFLYYNASPLGVSSPIDNVASLVEGGEVKNGVCFSEEGMQKYHEWAPLWKVARVEETPSMPEGWGNTGVSNGTPTSGRPPTGNTEGWMVVFVDATSKEIGRHGVMKRCGNPVTHKPVAPEGPTDEGPPDVEKPKPEKPKPPEKPRGGKDHRKSPVSSDRNHPDERVRPVIPTPPTVIRHPDAPPPPPQPRPKPGEPPGRGDSGHGPTNTTTPPTTVAPPPAPPITAPPTTNPPPPPPGSF